jgi:hypothetical protein
MQDPNKRRKKRGKLYFSSSKALKTSRMGKKKMAVDRFGTEETTKVLDFQDTGENATLSTVAEFQGPSMSRGVGSQYQGETAEEEAEETSLMEPEG